MPQSPWSKKTDDICKSCGQIQIRKVSGTGMQAMEVSHIMQFRHMIESCAHVHEWIIDGDDEDLSRVLQCLAVEVARYVRLRARRA